MLFILIVLFPLYIGFPVDKNLHHSDCEAILADKITYENLKDESVKIRLKYFTDYEFANPETKKINSSIYNLYVNDILTSEAHSEHSFNLPKVSEVYNLEKDDSLILPFKIKLNDGIDRNLVRIDVTIIVEELIQGKWVPVYQIIFMERGPYWSLDKGPIEVIEETS